MTLGRDLFTLALICVWFNPLAFSLSISRITVVVSLRILFLLRNGQTTIVKGGAR